MDSMTCAKQCGKILTKALGPGKARCGCEWKEWNGDALTAVLEGTKSILFKTKTRCLCGASVARYFSTWRLPKD